MLTSNISNELMLEIQENVPAIIAYHDLQQRIVWANRAYRQALGVSLQELDGQACYRLWGLSKPCRDCPVAEALATGETAESELTPETQDEWPEDLGSWLIRAVPIREQNGRIAGAVEVALEVTERKKAEQERLEESEERYRGIFEQAGDGIFLMDRSGSIKDCNPAACSLLGYRTEELLGNNFLNFISSESFARQAFPGDGISAGEHVRVERELLCKNGSRRTMEESLVELHTGDLLVMLRDITDRKRMEYDLAKERRLLQAIIDNIPVMMTHYDPDSKMLYLNKEFERVVGWTTDEVQHIDMMEQVYPDPDYRRQVWEYMKEASSEWREFRVRSRHGDIIDSEWSNIMLDNGTQVGIGIDVRERKRAEEELRRKSEEQAVLLESIPVQLWYLKDLETYGAVNQAHADFLGLPRQAIEHKPLQAFFPEDVVQVCKAVNVEVFETKEPVFTEEWVDDARGDQRLLAITKTPKLNRNNEVEYVVCAAWDITERAREKKKREQLLKDLEDREALLRAIFENAPEGIVVCDDEARIEMTNPAADDLYTGPGSTGRDGGSPGQLTILGEDGKPCHPRELPLSRSALNGEYCRHVELRIEWPQGEKRWLLVNSAPVLREDGRQSGAVGLFQDITHRKRMELELSKERKLFKAIVDHIPVMLARYDPETDVVHFNREFERIIQWTSDEVQSVSEILEKTYPDPEYRKHVFEYMKKTTMDWQEFRPLSRTGEPIDSIWTNVRLEDGTLIGIGLDIRERKQAETELQKSEEKYKKLFHASPEAIAQVDADGVFLTANQSMAERFHLSSGELEGRSFHDVLAHDLAEERLRKGRRVIESGEMLYFEDERDGRVFQNYYVPISCSDGKESFQVISKDVTATRKMEEKLREKVIYDSLTHVYSRLFFEEELKRLNDSRYFPVGIIICDVDGLKLVNDTLGHDIGDYLLKSAASILNTCFRSSDIVARIGGDEFAVILPQSNEELICACCGRIRNKLDFFNRMHPELSLSVSIGYAVENDSPVNMNDLFKRADDAMYKEKIQQDSSSRNAIVQALIKIMEVRDYITKGHADRLQSYTLRMGKRLGLSEEKINDLHLLSRFHDLGKVGVPDKILFKPGPLTEKESQEMQNHCKVGQRIALRSIDLAPIADLILKHHEWWNGTGYPLGLRGRDIPLECRILAVVDAYDTMTSERPYKKAKSHEEATAELRRHAGTQFDPDLVDLFIEIVGERPINCETTSS